MRQPDSDPVGTLLFSGRIFCDLVFTGAAVPVPGTEVFADGFLVTPGGVANKAMAAARVGAHTTVLSTVGEDPLGQQMLSLLEREPLLDTRFVERRADWQTPVTVALTGAEDRSFITYVDPLDVGREPAGLGPVRALHVTLDRELPGWVADHRATGTQVVGGVGWDHTGEWSERVVERLGDVDVFVPNDLEAMRFTRTDTPRAAARALSRRVPLTIVTCGGDGLIAIDSADGLEIELPAFPVPVTDTTGAGDVFVASFMAAPCDWDLTTRLRFAGLCAAISVTGLGGAASAPHAHELPASAARIDPAGEWSFLSDLAPRPAPLPPEQNFQQNGPLS